MRLLVTFFRAYPGQSAVMLVALLFAGIAEGVGLSALLPLLSIAIRDDAGSGGAEMNTFERTVTDTLASLGIQPDIGTLLVVIVIGITLKSLLLLVAKKQVGYTAARVATDLRLDMLRAILKSRWSYFLNQPVGKLTNALATEAHRSSEAFVNGATVITLLIQAVIYGAVAVAVSWKATLVSLGAGVFIVGISHFLVRMARKAGKRQTNLFVSLMARLTDTLQSVKPLKAMGREHLADSVLTLETSKVNKALRKQVFAAAVLNAAQEEMFTIVIALGMFVALVKLDMPLATVMVLVVVLGKMLAQLGKVQKQYQKMAMGESAYWSIRQSIAEAVAAEEQPGKGALPSLRSGICIRSMRFAHGDHPVFTDLNVDIPAGELVTLVGPSGVGKTTVLDLLTGLIEPDSGQIEIDGVPLSGLDLKAWRRMIGYVPQETLLLHDSILHNVTLGDPELSEADACAALESAGAWKFVSRFPEGIHHVVGERGGKLSGGQRQRIVIARALVHKPDFLILDEATSALDPSTEAEICSTLRALRGRLTILAISHQDALVKAADRVYRLADGRAAPTGPGQV